MARMDGLGVYLGHPLLPQLDKIGIEFDQRMQQAWETCATPFVTELQLLEGLRGLGAQGLECLPQNWVEIGDMIRAQSEHSPGAAPGIYPILYKCHPMRAEAALRFDVPIWCKAIELAGESKTLSSRIFCQAISETFLSGWSEQQSMIPLLLRFLALCHGERYDSGIGDFTQIPRLLETMPKTRNVIEKLGRVPKEPDDFQYLLCLEEGNLAFRTVSSPHECAFATPSYEIIGARALLTHFKEAFGAFTLDEIRELEDLIRNTKATEKDFQQFFENHQHFFRRWDVREVYPQMYLTREDQGPLIPDFILTNSELQRAAIVELKLAKPKLVTRQPNRDRFAACIMEARAQLLEYRDWFEERENRQRLKKVTGMEIFRPNLAVVIGNSSCFRSGVDRQKLASRHPDIEVVTYDDLVSYARNRLIGMRTK